MSSFDESTLKTLTNLARIQCSEEIFDQLLNNLKQILSYFDELKEVDTDGISECNSVLEELCNAMREDEVGETLKTETFLSNSPSHVGGMIRVPPVIKF